MFGRGLGQRGQPLAADGPQGIGHARAHPPRIVVEELHESLHGARVTEVRESSRGLCAHRRGAVRERIGKGRERGRAAEPAECAARADPLLLCAVPQHFDERGLGARVPDEAEGLCDPRPRGQEARLPERMHERRGGPGAAQPFHDPLGCHVPVTQGMQQCPGRFVGAAGRERLSGRGADVGVRVRHQGGDLPLRAAQVEPRPQEDGAAARNSPARSAGDPKRALEAAAPEGVLKRLATVVLRRQPTRVEQCEQILLCRRAPRGLTAECAELLEAHVCHRAGAQRGHPCHAPMLRAAFRAPAQDAFGQHKEGQAQEKADRSYCEKSRCMSSHGIV